MERVENPILRAKQLGLNDGIAGKPSRRQDDFSYVCWIAYCRGYREGQEEARYAKYARAAMRRAEKKMACGKLWKPVSFS